MYPNTSSHMAHVELSSDLDSACFLNSPYSNMGGHRGQRCVEGGFENAVIGNMGCDHTAVQGK